MTHPARQVVDNHELAGEHVRTPDGGVPCEGCRTLFTPRRLSQRFCRPACRPLAHRRRLREWRQGALPDDPGRPE